MFVCFVEECSPSRMAGLASSRLQIIGFLHNTTADWFGPIAHPITVSFEVASEVFQ